MDVPNSIGILVKPRWWVRSIALLACLPWFAVSSVEASVLVLSPYPDDDIITAAGVISAAAGWNEVTVVYMTNGDISGTASGLLRQGEAVSAQVGYLGTAEDNLIFLGYPDGALAQIFNSYRLPTDQYVGPSGQGTTYGNRGLGRLDYHSYMFGIPAPYNLPNIVLDLEAVLRTYRPTQIFTTSEFDQHSDHATTYRIFRLALDNVHASDSTYAPVINKTIVWSSQSTSWPGPTAPTTFHTEPRGYPRTSAGSIGRALTFHCQCRILICWSLSAR